MYSDMRQLVEIRAGRGGGLSSSLWKDGLSELLRYPVSTPAHVYNNFDSEWDLTGSVDVMPIGV